MKIIFNKSIMIVLIFIVGTGLIITITSRNEVSMNILVSLIALFAKNSNHDKIAEIILSIGGTYWKFVLIVIGIYVGIFALANPNVIKHPIESIGEIKHKMNSSMERIKYASKVRKFKKAGRLKHAKPLSVTKSDTSKILKPDTDTIRKTRKWPEDISAKNLLVKEKIEEIVDKKGNYTITEVMKSIEKDFDLSIKEKHYVLDDVGSIITSSNELAKLKKKKGKK